MSIKDKLFWGYSVLIFFALLSTVLISQNYTERAFYENTVSAHKRELTLITNSLQSEIDHIGDYEMSVALDSTVISTLEKNPFVTETDAEYNVVRRVLGNTINSIIGMNQEIFQWDIITLDNRFLYVSGYDLLTSIEDTLGPAYFTEANSGRSIVLNGPFMVEGSGETQTAMPIFVMSKQIVKLETLEALGYVAFFVTEDSIASVFEENIPQGAKADFFLISQDNTILSSSKKDVIGKDLAEVMNLSEKNEQEIFQKGTWVNGRDKNSALYTVTPMEQNGWRVVYVTPLEALMNSHYSVRKIVTLIGIVTFLLSIVMIAVIAQRITYPIVYLFQKMITYYRQEPETRIVIDSKDEIKNLYLGFDAMVKDTQRLMNQIYCEQKEKSDYKFQLIQSQIKPHFLYNTLETIKSLIDIGMNDAASEAVMAMSQFYRMSLNDGNDITSVANEVELSRQYMYIQKLRYMEYLNYEIYSCGGLENYVIPKLTMQPLLENAIYHGIKKKQQGNGKIVIHINESENELTIVIEDNGAGIEEQELQKLNQLLQAGRKEEEKSFGIYSINRRIHLFFGDEYGLILESKKDIFTRVVLKIPKMEVDKTVIQRYGRQGFERNGLC